MKISHEVPIRMLPDSRGFNDYDYALVHLFDERPQYFGFYKESLAMGREVILDNSLFELGDSFDGNEYEGWIRLLKPTYYVIPDSFNDTRGSIESAESWANWIPKSDSKSMAVVHGTTYEEILECYKAYDKLGIDKIAFNYCDDVYKTHCKCDYELLTIMHSRVKIIEQLRLDGVLNENKPHHILGCTMPDEFLFYRGCDYIDTIDTSHPIICGIEGIMYKEWGNNQKPKSKIIDYMDISSIPNKDIIAYNVDKFKEIAGVK